MHTRLRCCVRPRGHSLSWPGAGEQALQIRGRTFLALPADAAAARLRHASRRDSDELVQQVVEEVSRFYSAGGVNLRLRDDRDEQDVRSRARLASSGEQKPNSDDRDGDGIGVTDAFLGRVWDAAIGDMWTLSSLNMWMHPMYNVVNQGYGSDCDDDHGNAHYGGNANGKDNGSGVCRPLAGRPEEQ